MNGNGVVAKLLFKNKLWAMLPGKLHYNGLLCMQELNFVSHKFYLTYDWHIFPLYDSQK